MIKSLYILYRFGEKSGFPGRFVHTRYFVHTNYVFTTEKQYDIINLVLTTTRRIDYEENIDFCNGYSSIGIDGVW